MGLFSFIRQGNSPRSGLALSPEQVGQMLHHLEERVQALEQEPADHKRETEDEGCLRRHLQAVEQAHMNHQRETAAALRLGRRLQAQRDARFWQLLDDLRGEVEALWAERTPPEDRV